MVCDWEDVLKFVVEARNRGAMLSNFFQSKGTFDVLIICDTTFLLKSENGFKHMYFFTKSVETLTRDLVAFYASIQVLESNQLHLVVDVLGPDRGREPLEKVFQLAGWEVLTVLQRMGRKTPVKEIEAASSDDSIMAVVDTTTLEDVPVVMSWFREFFDAEQEQLPDSHQIGEWIDKGTLLVSRARGTGVVTGFVAYDLSPAQLYLRYWFVHPSARGTGVGGALLRRMFSAGVNTKRQYFWVKTDNENAIQRYKHYGFQFEPMKNTVLRTCISHNKMV